MDKILNVSKPIEIVQADDVRTIQYKQVVASFTIGIYHYNVYKLDDQYSIEHKEAQKTVINFTDDWKLWKEERENYVRLIEESPTYEIGEVIFGKNSTVQLDLKAGGQGIHSQDKSIYDLRAKHGL